MEVSLVRRFEEEWIRFLHTEHGEIVTAMHDRMEFTDAIVTGLDMAVGEFKERFGG